ncbi:MAG TPA: lytic transglycosylase domain-containing protein [Gaiellaceae bacterium]|nr:lytic transglycosylase domain-containing protein [Gaiellaceae bacterium]
MRLRLVGLLLVTGACTWLGVAVSTASAEKSLSAVQPIASPAVQVAGRSCPLPPRFRPAFARAARDTGLPLALLVSVARVESNVRAQARSRAGARGLLQVMPGTARELALDPNHPPSNVLAGARYLRLMLDRFHSTDLALAAYNAGPSAVAKAGGAPSAETLTYVANVTRQWRRLNGCG